MAERQDARLPATTPIGDYFNLSTTCRYREMQCQRHSLLFLCSIAYKNVTKGGRMRVLHTLDHSSFCTDYKLFKVPEGFAEQLKAELQKLVSEGTPIEMVTVKKEELAKYFHAQSLWDKSRIVSHMTSETVDCVKFGDHLDLGFGQQYERVASKLGAFDVQQEGDGFFLRYPGLLSGGVITPWKGAPLQHKLLCNFGHWARRVHSDSLEDLNKIVGDGKVDEISVECDKFNRHELSDIAKSLADGFAKRRVIAISGPSSCGKSTFSAMIAKDLKEVGHGCLVFSMDNYFVDRALTPKDAEGKYDFESIHALHLDLMTTRIHALLRGEAVPRRVHDFKPGLGSDVEGETIKLEPTDFLVLEGINGINPALLDMIGQDLVTKVLVYPMTPISLDAEHCFEPTDLLLLRRIIRDHDERGYSPRLNVAWWPDVCVGEARNITPNLRSVDLFYNSSLIYELAVLSTVGTPMLREALEATESDPVIAKEVTAETRRLLGLLEMFSSIPVRQVPRNSTLYEFVQGLAERSQM